MKKCPLTIVLVCATLAVSFGSGRSDQTSKAQSRAIPDDVQKLIQALQSKDLGTRMAAAKDLGAMAGRAEPAVPFLIRMLGDTEKFYFDGFIEGRMTGGSRSGGDEAAEALVRIGEPSLQPLIAALDTQADPLVRWGAAGALGKINDGRSVEPLIRALADKDESVARAAAWSLGHMKVQGIAEVLYARLTDRAPAVAEGVLAALAQQGDARVLSLLTGRLKGSDLNSRLSALTLLGWLKSPESFQPISTALRDADPRIRKAAADSLGELKDRRALAGLVQLLEDSESSVRYSAVVALMALRDPGAVEPLRGLLSRESDLNVRQAAEAAIKLISK
jgi:HEAT repeat protein